MPERLKIISRDSNLALKQVEEVIFQVPGLSDSLIIKEKAFGDKHKDISLLQNTITDFFTRELDESLLNGNADIAIHSAKDLPCPLTEGLELICLFQAFDKSDSLVSRNHLPLAALSPGSRIGTSALLRKQQVETLRPDLETVSIRGTIEERIKLIDENKIDALVVASCALRRLGLEHEISEVLGFKTHPLQGNLAVLAKTGRSNLKALFYGFDARNTYGKVFLVGAGPGDPELITVKARRLINEADIIFYDDLLDNLLLKDAVCEKVYVGKRKGNHYQSQAEINKLLYRKAVAGYTVIRLKGGDPFIYGRGGEELTYLSERLIEVDIVPGISAAQTASSSLQVPLTMRGRSNKVSFLTGHSAAKHHEVKETFVYYMGATTRTRIKNDLISKGLSLETPALLVQQAGGYNEKHTKTFLGELDKGSFRSPLIIIVGENVHLYRNKSRILFTGLNPSKCSLPGKLVHYPLIEIQAMPFSIVKPGEYDYILFTSKHAVEHFLMRYEIGENQKIIAIGPYTRSKLELYGYAADICPQEADSDSLYALIKEHTLLNILYPCSNISNNKLHLLNEVNSVPIYKTVNIVQPPIDLNSIDGIVFTSSSTVDSFFNIYDSIPKHLLIYTYGKHSAQKIKKMRVPNIVQTIQI